MSEGGGQSFKVGEVIGKSGTIDAVVIQITKVEADEIVAKVIELGESYSAVRLGRERGFVFGERIFFEKSGGGSGERRWIVRYPLGRSWMILGVNEVDGSKYFEH